MSDIGEGLKQLVQRFRARIADLGTAASESFSPVYGTTELVLKREFIEVESVYRGPILLTSSSYNVSGNTVVLHPPADGHAVFTVNYLYFKIPTQTVEMYLSIGCDAASSYIGKPFALDDPSLFPHKAYYQLIVLLALRDYTVDRMSIMSGSMVSWRDEEKSMTKQGVSSFQSPLDSLQDAINRELMSLSKPRVRSGGQIPRKASEFPGDY